MYRQSHSFIRRRFTAWIACFALLLAALAPSISHALSAAKGERWFELCSAEGVKYLKLGSDTPDTVPPAGQAGAMEHCPFCATHGSAAPLPAASALVLPQLDAPATMPGLFYQSPRPLAIWSIAQSRAPPAVL